MEVKIDKMQRIYGYDKLQEKIDNGEAWQSVPLALQAAVAINKGACMLPPIPHRDLFRKSIPSRYQAYYNEAGSVDFCREYWRVYWKVKCLIISN